MRWPITVLLAGLLALSHPAEAATLKSVRVTETAKVPRVRSDFPVPAEPNQLIYLQRSTNSNTVVYTARFDAAGNLDPRNPVSVYWRRYNTDGSRKPLKRIEQMFAYGVSMRPGKTAGEFVVTLKPAPQFPMLLRQTGPGRAEVFGTIGGRLTRVVYLFVDVDESGMIPQVTGLSLYGIDVQTGRAISETFAVSGGSIRQ